MYGRRVPGDRAMCRMFVGRGESSLAYLHTKMAQTGTVTRVPAGIFRREDAPVLERETGVKCASVRLRAPCVVTVNRVKRELSDLTGKYTGEGWIYGRALSGSRPWGGR